MGHIVVFDVHHPPAVHDELDGDLAVPHRRVGLREVPCHGGRELGAASTKDVMLSSLPCKFCFCVDAWGVLLHRSG